MGYGLWTRRRAGVSGVVRAVVATVAVLLGFSGFPAWAQAQCGGGSANGVVNAGEECDDGNGLSGDGCDSRCVIETGFECKKPLFYSDMVVVNQNESFPASGKGDWVVAPNELSALQVNNTDTGTIALFGVQSQVGTYQFSMIAETTQDDDLMGFVLGFDENEQSLGSDGEYLLVDWQKNSQVFGGDRVVTEGMRLLHVTRAVSSTLHESDSVRLLTRATTLADTGWEAFAENRVQVTYREDSLVVYINGVVEFSVTPQDFPGEFDNDRFPGGDIGFFARSLENVRFRVTSDTSSTCNDTSLSDTSVEVPVGTANLALNVFAAFSDSRDGFDGSSVQVGQVTGDAVASVLPDGSVLLSPTDPNSLDVYTMTVTACDNNPDVVACDTAVFTVTYVDADSVDRCESDVDCPGSACHPVTQVCMPVTCGDQTAGQDETDVDCGGSCAPCAEGLTCEVNGDCATSACLDFRCVAALTDVLDGAVNLGFVPTRGAGGAACDAGGSSTAGGVLLGYVFLFLLWFVCRPRWHRW